MDEKLKSMNSKLTNLFFFIIIITAWLFSYYRGIATAIDVWVVSEIFTHCFLVIPAACYLIFQKRSVLSIQPFQANYWLIIPIIGTLILYTFGYIGDIRLFMHVAAFTSLPLIIWLVIGTKAAKKILFPLYFMVFAIPIGESIIPFLQELTTDLAVPLLDLTGVPVFRNGLYLDIPKGRFLVAEACSGISFLITSVVFGNLYAYLSFRTFPRQLLFVFISFVVPILANAIRVYGIILTAHLSDMKYAAGADHLIYGGVFYTLILFLLIFIGEKFRNKNINTSEQEVILQPSSVNKFWPVTTVIVGVFIGHYIWLTSIESNRSLSVSNKNLINLNQLPFVIEQDKFKQWQPSFPNADEIQQGYIMSEKNVKIDFFVAAYNSGKGELISSLNKLYDDLRWTLVNSKDIRFNISQQPVQLTELVSPLGETRYIIHWFQVEGVQFTSRVKAKVYQTSKLLLGNKQSGSLIAFSIESSNNSIELSKVLTSFVSNKKNVIDSVSLNQ
jgi:exosortase A